MKQELINIAFYLDRLKKNGMYDIIQFIKWEASTLDEDAHEIVSAWLDANITVLQQIEIQLKELEDKPVVLVEKNVTKGKESLFFHPWLFYYYILRNFTTPTTIRILPFIEMEVEKINQENILTVSNIVDQLVPADAMSYDDLLATVHIAMNWVLYNDGDFEKLDRVTSEDTLHLEQILLRTINNRIQEGEIRNIQHVLLFLREQYLEAGKSPF